MECFEIEAYLADYVQRKLGFVPNLKLRRHLKKCPGCRNRLTAYQKVLNLLEYDILPEPPLHIWQQMQQRAMEISQTIPFLPKKKPYLKYGAVGFFVLASVLFVLLLALPATQTPDEEEVDSSLFWTFFKSEMWDFGGFFHRVNEEKLAEMTPHIEKEFCIRLEQELQLKDEDISRLFPLLKKFGHTSKDYYYRYYAIMASLSQAVESGKSAQIETYLDELQKIRRQWLESQWHFLTEVRLVLNMEQYARFLLFTERVPQELYTIYAQVCSEQG